MKFRKRALAFVLVVIGTAVVGLQTPALAAVPPGGNGPWQIMPRVSSLCLEVQGASKENSAQVQQYTCWNDAQQVPIHRQWYFANVSSNYYRIYNRNSGRCMNVQGATTVNSAKVVQYTCGSGMTPKNDVWEQHGPENIGGFDWYYFVNVNSRKCLNVQGANDNLGSDLIQYDCSVGNFDAFRFTWAKPN